MSHNNKRRNRNKQNEPPTLADIVREKTNDGKVIVDFYLDVVRGKLDDEGFEVCHRLEAAEQLQAVAPGLVSEYIAQLTGVECGHAILRKRTRDLDCIPREDREPLPSRDTVRARPEALEYLASALAAPSLKNDPRVAGIVHESTDHGKTVVSFLLHVMHGVVRGFRPRNRIEAASELLGHIARDELVRSGSLTPSPLTGEGWGEGEEGRAGSASAEPALSPAAEPALSPAEPALSSVEGSSPVPESSFPRRACPVPDTGREPIPSPATAETDDREAPGPAEADPTVIPAEAGIQGGRDEDGSTPTEADAAADPTVIPAESLPRTRYGAGIQQGGDGDDADDTDDHRGCYDIDRKITEAQRDPSHPIHKFVQAYDEVAAAFHGEDKKNDDDEEVRYWISGEVVDAYGKYIWEYAPAYPRSIRRKLRPKRRRRSREPGTAPKAESIWMKRPSDKMREAGIKPPKRTLMWI